MRLSLLLAFRLLRNHSGRSLFSPMNVVAVSGIAFGMAATLVSLSVVSGFQKTYEQAILGFNAHVVLMHDNESGAGNDYGEALKPFFVSDADAAYWSKNRFWWRWLGNLGFFRDSKMEILRDKGVRALTPFIFREGLGVFPDSMESVVLKGVDPKTMGDVYPLRYQALEKTDGEPSLLFSQKESFKPVIIGKKLLEKYFPENIPPEPLVKILLPREGKSRNIKDYTQTFRVVGTFESGLYEFDSQFVLASLADLQGLFHLDNQISGVEMVLDDRYKAPHLARVIEKAMPAYQAISWDELNESLFSAMKMEKTLFVVVMSLILLIASFNIMGIIMMRVLGSQSEIAILRTMGLPQKMLGQTFVLHGTGLGAIGVILGLFLSVLLMTSLNRLEWFALDPQIYFVSRLPIEWNTALWIVLSLGALILCYLVSRLAARVARQTGLMQTYR